VLLLPLSAGALGLPVVIALIALTVALAVVATMILGRRMVGTS
jgi:hypothetical protein